jgi:hypothetical protein
MKKIKLKTLRILALVFFTTIISAQNTQTGVDQPKAIGQLLEFKKDLSAIDFFKIQIYSGSDPSQAEKKKIEFMEIFDQWPVIIAFQTPNYKVWIGNFRNRIEADRAVVKLKKDFPEPLIIQPKKE